MGGEWRGGIHSDWWCWQGVLETIHVSGTWKQDLTTAVERWTFKLRKLGVYRQWRRWQQDTPQGKDIVWYFHVCLPRWDGRCLKTQVWSCVSKSRPIPHFLKSAPFHKCPQILEDPVNQRKEFRHVSWGNGLGIFRPVFAFWKDSLACCIAKELESGKNVWRKTVRRLQWSRIIVKSYLSTSWIFLPNTNWFDPLHHTSVAFL